MKKQEKSVKKNRSTKTKKSSSQYNGNADSPAKTSQKKPVSTKPAQSNRKKSTDQKKAEERGIMGYIAKSRQFLREAKIELKKVKWPTRKELFASTAVVIFLSLLMAFYFWIVDMGLIVIIKGILA